LAAQKVAAPKPIFPLMEGADAGKPTGQPAADKPRTPSPLEALFGDIEPSPPDEG
jgi:hypothetical protein